jgi:dihydroflavonol-4-reductase
MTETVLVTGATGLAGANICRLLIERGDKVRALARPSADTQPLVALGVQVISGDITDADDVLSAGTGADSAIHCAALLGGASQNLPDFEAVNIQGTKHVLDVAAALGMRRVVAVSTGTFFDTTGGLEREDAPVMEEPSSDPYTTTKMAAFQDAMARATTGQDVVTTHPGAIFGPSPVASNALGRTSFNRVLLSALRQRITQYLTFPVSWVFAEDIAHGCILALDRGVSGERYMLDGRPEDVVSTAEACNRICALAGIDHRVEDVEPSDDPELLAVFGPTLMAIAFKLASVRTPRRALTESKTYKRLGYEPISLDEGLRRTAEWLREIGRLDRTPPLRIPLPGSRAE